MLATVRGSSKLILNPESQPTVLRTHVPAQNNLQVVRRGEWRVGGVELEWSGRNQVRGGLAPNSPNSGHVLDYLDGANGLRVDLHSQLRPVLTLTSGHARLRDCESYLQALRIRLRLSQQGR